MDYSIKDVAERLKGLRETLDYSIETMAQKTATSIEDYTRIENGEKDFSITFLYKCAEVLGVDLIELLTGDNPKLKKYCVVRKGTGLPIERRERFEYQHLAYMFKNKQIEPLLVTAPYEAEAQDKPIILSTHDGQEFDYLISGSLKMSIDGKIKILNAGDAIYYDSSAPHGMIAVNGENCVFMAILIKN